MERIRESTYEAVPGEPIQILVKTTGTTNDIHTVALNGKILEPDANGIHEFKKSDGGNDSPVVECLFLDQDPPSANYQVVVQEKGGKSWDDRVIKHSDDKSTWTMVITFRVGNETP